jgi:dTDP-4-dehydrorhamnose reductase
VESTKKKKARIFILGISGFLGYHLAWRLREKYSVTGSYFSNLISIPDVHTFPIDLTKKEYVDRLIRMLRPDFTIMASGINDSKRCADNPKLAEAMNTYIPLELAQSAVQHGAKNIHLSCSQIFDGSGKNAGENDKNFTSQAFGRTKLTGESYIRSQTMENTTIRFGKVLGLSHYRRPSYLDKLRSSLSQGKKTTLKEVKTYNFMSIDSFVSAIEAVIENNIPPTQRVFHVGGPAMKEIDMSRLIAKAFGASPDLIQEQLQQNEEEFEGLRISSKRDYSLSTELFETTYGWKPETIDGLMQTIRSHLIPASREISKELKTSQSP